MAFYHVTLSQNMTAELSNPPKVATFRLRWMVKSAVKWKKLAVKTDKDMK